MAKIRVYELATRLGLDNKEIVDKLTEAGIEVKNHMSSIEEADAQKFEAVQSGKTGEATQGEDAVEVKVKEERISSGLIRRRRKTIAKEEEAPEEEATPVVAEEAVVEGQPEHAHCRGCRCHRRP